MVHTWKVPHVIKGILTYAPALNAWRSRRATTAGSSSARYCYAVWLRHLVVLSRYGFDIDGAAVGELGPGDTIGTGFAALFSGARRYTALDIVPFARKLDLDETLAQLAHLFVRQEAIPDHQEFPLVRPRLQSYEYPAHLIHSPGSLEIVSRISNDLAGGLGNGHCIHYAAPWTSVDVGRGSLDLVFSQAVLQYVENIEGTYRAFFTWLKPGGYCSHAIGLGAMHLSPYWNGHWAYSNLEWQLLCGRREFVPNRAPLSAHIAAANRAGFHVLHLDRQPASGGLGVHALSPRFRSMSHEDLSTSGAMVVLHKPLGHLSQNSVSPIR